MATRVPEGYEQRVIHAEIGPYLIVSGPCPGVAWIDTRKLSPWGLSPGRFYDNHDGNGETAVEACLDALRRFLGDGP